LEECPDQRGLRHSMLSCSVLRLLAVWRNAPIRGDYDRFSGLLCLRLPFVWRNAPIRGDYDSFVVSATILLNLFGGMPRSEGITTMLSRRPVRFFPVWRNAPIRGDYDLIVPLLSRLLL